MASKACPSSSPIDPPIPLAIGHPTDEYPWKWSIYRWIKGEIISASKLYDPNMCAKDLAAFLTVLHQIDTTGGPQPGFHNFYRGGELIHYDTEVRKALTLLKGKINTEIATDLWKEAIATKWEKPPVWVHGDISTANLLEKEGRLCAVIDFGQLAIGDPACDLAIAWTFFTRESRETFRSHLPLDAPTWNRGCAWTLWKAVVIASGLMTSHPNEIKYCWHVINEVLPS